MKSFDRRFLVACGAIVSAWLGGGALLVPAVIRSAYRQESVSFLNDVFSGRTAHPVDYYLNAWWSAFRLGTPALLALLVVGYVVLRYRGRLAAVLRPRDATFSAWDAIQVSVAMGLLAGVAEASAVVIKILGRNAPSWGMGISAEIAWMAPLGYALLFGFVAALLTVPAALIRGKRMPVRYLVFGLTMLGCYSLFRSLRVGFHAGALLILALGVATQAARFGESAPSRVVRYARRWSIAAVAACVACAVVMGIDSRTRRPLGEAPGGAVNVLFIILDTVRAASVGFLGYDGGTTPQLDRYAQGALVFEQAISPASWTLPSHASMFTGRMPHELSAAWDAPLDDTYPTLAEILSARGYRTGGFVGNEYYASRRSGLSRGFQTYADQPVSFEMLVSNTWALRKLVARLYGKKDIVPPQGMWGRNKANDVNRKFLHWLDRGGDRPYFAFLNYMDAHDPYYSPSPFDTLYGGEQFQLRWDWYDRYSRKELKDRSIAYNRSIRFLDAQVGELLAELERRGALENTIVVIAADHGEQFGERTQKEVLHGRNLYLSALHVPLVIGLPRDRRLASRIAAQVSTRDIAATILDVAGAEGHPLPGESLARYWRADAVQRPPVQVATLEEETAVPAEVWKLMPPGVTLPNWTTSMRSLLDGPYHYIRNGDGTEELYDVRADFWEREELKGIVRDTLVRRFRSTLPAVFGTEPAVALRRDEP